jgi:NADH-quinone oxidoreductase subunit N
MAAAMAVFLLSLGGLPPTAGFVGKWYVFSAAIASGYYGLAIIGVLTSIVSIFFYLRVIVMMYMAPPAEVARAEAPSAGAVLALAVSVVVTFYLGVMPARIIDIASKSISTIF